MTFTAEQLEQNWEKFLSMCKHTGPGRADAVIEMCETFGERLALAPASGRTEHHNAFPGGLVDHSIRVLVNARSLSKALNVQLPTESIVLCALFHDLGKVGNEKEDYYLPQDSDWHREKLGEMYKTNKNLQYMTVPHRGLYLLQKFGVVLTQDEYIAIMIHDGQHCPENKPYSMQEPMLASVLMMADFSATKQEKALQTAPKQQEVKSEE